MDGDGWSYDILYHHLLSSWQKEKRCGRCPLVPCLVVVATRMVLDEVAILGTAHQRVSRHKYRICWQSQQTKVVSSIFQDVQISCIFQEDKNLNFEMLNIAKLLCTAFCVAICFVNLDIPRCTTKCCFLSVPATPWTTHSALWPHGRIAWKSVGSAITEKDGNSIR